MRLDITGRQVTITPALQQLIARRLSRLERVLNDRAISATIILSKEKYRHQAEIVIHARGDKVLRATGEGNNWNPSLADAATRLEQQAKKLKSKFEERKRKSANARTVAEPAPPEARRPGEGARVLRNTRYPVKPMSVEDAALRVEESDENFVVFRNAETDAVSIVYRRKNGSLGLIEPQ
jgi:putative sigma-54 modulation protein